MNELQDSLGFARSGDNVSVLAQQWAKKYIRKLDAPTEQVKDITEAPSAIAKDLTLSLRTASSQAWQRTEKFLGEEVKRHDLDPDLIDPWEISKDIHDIYKRTLAKYGESIPPVRLATLIGAEVGRVRRKYTAVDPRVIAFVSMQFHSTGEILLQQQSAEVQNTLRSYFKVIDDHLYMPLHRAYAAAAEHAYDSPTLKLVQQLLPSSTDMAQSICQRVVELYPRHRCHSGLLSHPTVKISSIRDVEMFQIYLWVCLLENSLEALQQELFPLCVMLYPVLNVSWELVQQLVHLLGKEIQQRIQPEEAKVLLPYYLALREMFSPQVFA